LRNPRLARRELNFSVQRTIDRLVDVLYELTGKEMKIIEKGETSNEK
jgi:hypothetical protein